MEGEQVKDTTPEVKEEKQESEEKRQESQEENQEEYRWWIIRVAGGKEDEVKEHIEKIARTDPRIKEVFVPEEEERLKKKTKSGEKEIVRKKKIISGYVYVKMKLENDLWNKIRTLSSVGYILGEKGTPIPVPEEKIQSLKEKVVGGEISKIFKISVGDRVKIKSGPLSGLTGVVEWISEDRSKLRILISIFGRQTPLEIETAQVEKE